ncbi:MAG: hypothetical protein J1F05_08535 [Muribaculaceae bacterium]|nr:hypothetical protein [Muribaculaceae bacterium]
MEQTSVNISLVSVREVDGATAINRRALRRLGRAPINVDMNIRVVPDIEHSMISLVVTCSYITVLGLIRTKVLSCSVVTTFEIEDLMTHISLQGEEVIIGGKLMMTMVSLAVGSLRGVIAVRTANTSLRYRPLPIIDLSALTYRLQKNHSASSIIPM